MKKRIVIVTVLVAGVIIANTVLSLSAAKADTTTSTSTSAAAADLQAQIDAKNKQLTAINQQIQSTQASLKSTQKQKTTLQSQLSSLDGNISTLNLNIQADTLTTQQLQLEIEQLNGNMSDITASVSSKEQAIGAVLHELQKQDTTNGNIILLLLKGKSLADGVFEIQNLKDLQAQLSTDVGTLQDLNTQYNNKAQETTSKKADIASEMQDMQNRKSIVQDQEDQKKVLLASTKGQESTYQKQVSALLKQQQSIEADIEAADKALRAKINPSSLPSASAGVLLIPIAGFGQDNITQGYGATAFSKTANYVTQWHNGLDFGTPVGTPILAAEDGVVSGEANEDLYCPHGAYGKFISINHTNGLSTLYGHLSKQLVSIGDTVKRGQLIGYSGQTGYATGPHLHFGVYAESTFKIVTSKYCGPLPQGGDLDPSKYLF